ncbi:hypothetical protein BOX15_Mlig023603g1 [Macrostomum lignano]|uniref:Lipid scramblase CLPTM1L n=1 Tax=Macrostomum lignano TaxID=282301 RepID=A0A267GYM3_9PLAT|nr:hypothetical protein BOX15_Mlig023603g1 [Macrostomum lignano]
MPSFGGVLISLACIYVAYVGYQFLSIFYPKECTASSSTAYCLQPAFPLGKAKFTLELYGRASAVPGTKAEFIFAERSLKLTEPFERTFSVPLPVQVVKNASDYQITLALFPEGASHGVHSPDAVHSTITVTAFRKPGARARNLLGAGEDSSSKLGVGSESAKSDSPWIHWRSVLTINSLNSPFAFDRNAFPPELQHLVKLQSQDAYLPIISASRLSFKEADLVQVNSTDTRALLTLRFEPVSIGQLRLLQTLELSVESLKSFGFRDTDIDDVKAIFNDTNFYLLLLTIFVSVFHLVFDFLAFKNDIAFWRQMDRSVGISSTAVLWRCISGFVVLLYLAEEKTSLLVVAPAAVQLVIELWKLSKVFKVSISFRGLAWAPRSEAERKTGALDSQGTRYLSYVMLPLCAGAPIYSLMYVPHKSWYSWTINSMANCVYAFGFLFMTPQLFINYKMKSVAHLPWKALTYKAFNTFIDDLFAFIIRMPTAHRLACFRDDVIFIIYMYQRWLYPVDKSRTNEFGQSFDEAEPSSGDAGDKVKSE